MAVGMHTVNLANKWLDMLGGTAFTAPTNTYVKLHISAGDPGSAGTANASANTTRVILAWAAASGASKAITSTFPSWSSWASGSETLGSISVWDNISAGNVLFTATLTSNKSITNGDTFTLSSLSFALTPVMA